MMKQYILIAFLALSNWTYAQVDVFLIARNTGEKVLANKDTIRVFGFAEDLSSHPSIPGPTIYANEGDSVHIDVWNVSQGAPHTIHLHGLDVDQQNDGVPHLSFEIEHMDHGFYHFKAPHAGTYLYHCHVASTIHVQAGMYGLIVIRPEDGSKKTWTDGIAYQNEYAFMTSEIDTFWHHDSVLNHEHGHNAKPIEIPVYNPQFFLVNGLSDQQLDAYSEMIKTFKSDETYLRFANIGFYANEIVFPSQLNARIVSSDGRPLPTYENSDSLTVFPGERYGVLVKGSVLGEDSIQFNFRDLNTMILRNTQYVKNVTYEFSNLAEFNEKQGIKVYPNPTTSKVNLELNNHYKEVNRVVLMDVSGKIIHEQMLSSMKQNGMHQIEINAVTGVYELMLFKDNKLLAQSKLLVLEK
jgi:FtsP/CotA-like multicopper oxidase with cupredoxin domain